MLARWHAVLLSFHFCAFCSGSARIPWSQLQHETALGIAEWLGIVPGALPYRLGVASSFQCQVPKSTWGSVPRYQWPRQLVISDNDVKVSFDKCHMDNT
ncbi:hypothetical protein BJ166DRAFT_523001 [Pestalotiopsis sp. NC0098]|nr:hypothetical protein BJ166DRAFT_523001 [Pestalotiopsis sp. NC0098]